MERPRVAWTVGLPLLAAAWLSAHGLAYELVPPAPGDPGAASLADAHGYLTHAPLLVAVGLVLGTTLVLARPTGRLLPAWLFGAAPLAGFAVQEHLERLLQGGGAVWATAAEPVFLLGLLLQLPFGLVAALVARTLHEAAGALADPHAPPRGSMGPPLLALPRPVDLRPVPALASRAAGRAPPAHRPS
jgi:hypothetical protein